MKQVFTSAGYSQSNGKIERFIRSIKTECIRRTAILFISDARKQIDNYIKYYNYKRLHSAIFYITPYDILTGRIDEIISERNKKLLQARMKRISIYKGMNETTLQIDK